MLFPRALRFVTQTSALAAVLWLTACQSPPETPPPAPEAAKKPTGLFEWYEEGKSITSITINVDEQKAALYHGKKQIGWTYVATGITSFPTPTGEFKIIEKVANKVSNLYGKGYDANGKLINSDFKQGRDLLPPGGRFEAAKMTYFMRLTNDGVGMHIGPIPRPGRRASHGCIRLPSKIAGTIFSNVTLGTPVTITGSGPDYATYLKQSNAKAKANAAKLADAKKKAAEGKVAEAAKETAEATTLTADDPNGPGAAATTTITTLPATPVAPAAPAAPAPVAPAAPTAPVEEIKPAVPNDQAQ
ncbi:L,D-transpeptidase catalytic domain [Prosthecobacter debontii]|uniref:L,D-transpeptidase catalytic domain n=1 Tax=Prosthecobacter debontii TaxID=48467 RepID=A0A1T4Y6A5_9BACT|nr:L,D-transpeptidase [Prosthecobacter debontii]SKA97193.1 L,D-transpeptidase catalytic domain [Prosthecobacter debontii]